MSRFAKRFGYISLAIIAIGSAAVAAGNPTKGGVPSVQPHFIRPHLIATQAPFVPSQSLLNADMAVKTPLGPGLLYVETYPTDQQQNAPPKPGHGRPAGVLQHPSLSTVGRPHLGTRFVQPKNVVTGPPNVTGINHWWTYEEDSIAGVGKYMANVTTGNLIIQADDMATSHVGIELAFRRTYNSFSQHDYANTDGSVPSNYGDGWTNTFDAHIAYNDLNVGQGISVFDIDGARYDYSCTGGSPCTYVAPAGQYAKLVHDQSGDFKWTKKTGTVYWFHDPNAGITGVAGRLIEIVGRNNNTYLKFGYYFDTNHDNSIHLNEIRVVPEWAGSVGSATKYVDLKFADFTCGTGNCRLLSTLTWIDMTTQVSYQYTMSSPQLHVVNEPSNTSNNNLVLPQWYFYTAGTHLINSLNSARWAIQPSADGSFYNIFYSGNAVTSIQYFGFVNPTINDGTNSGPIQSQYSGRYGVDSSYRTVTFVNSTVSPVPTAPPPAPTPNPTTSPGCQASSTTLWYDTDGHESLYCFDPTSRVVRADHWTSSQWLVTNQSWDSSNDLVSTVDPRNNETDYAYDTNGNTTIVGQPAVNGIRATSRYTYDSLNNVLAYCDPNFDHLHSGDWGQTYSCPTSFPSSQTNGGPQIYNWAPPADGSEPRGQLTDSYTATGYHRHFNYDPAAQSGTDYGLPTSVVGDPIIQDDNNTYAPTQSFKYDLHGNLICYNKGNGWWALTYDAADRQSAAGDPDDASLVLSACGKTPGIPGSTIVTSHTYFLDGSIATVQSPSEAAQGVSTSYTYDPDGDALTETHHFSYTLSSPAPVVPTQKWYDGVDRLVEVEEPYDPRKFNDVNQTHMEFFAYPWVTRYLYDFTQNHTVSISGSSAFNAHGNLFDTQLGPQLQQTGAWTDTKGTAFDALDRPVDQYAYTTNSVLSTTSLSYDATPTTIGYLQTQCNSAGPNQCQIFDYNERGEKVSDSYSGSSPLPTMTYSHDTDGRVASVIWGSNGTELYSYNPDGAVTQRKEPAGGGVTSPATINYDYYADDTRQHLSVVSSGFTQLNLFDYSYRADRDLEKQTVTFAVGKQPGAYNLSWLYTAAGRQKSRTDTGPDTLNATTTDSYNATGGEFGQISSLALPVATLSNYTYDAENEPLTFQDPDPNVVENFTYDIRGELLAEDSNWVKNSSEQQAADGTLFPDVVGYAHNNVPIWDPSISNFNVQMGAQLSQIMSTYSGPSGGATATPIPQDPCDDPSDSTRATTWTYDGAGRQTGGTGGFWRHVHPLETICGSGTVAKTYDALNRISSQVTLGAGIPLNCGQGADHGSNYEIFYDWGPNGHPIRIGSPPAGTYPFGTVKYETLHWDGDVPLFTTNSSGTLDDIKVGTLADVTPIDTFSGLTIWDRDRSGSVVSSHNSSGYGGLGQPNPYHVRCMGFAEALGQQGYTAPSTFALAPLLVGQGGLLSEGGSDGIFDGANTIQGVRSFESTAGTWTTPDAYAGNAHDPISQRSYMWNRNNPVTYTDPSGYNVLLGFDSGGADGFGHSYIAIYDPLTLSGVVYSYQSSNGGAAFVKGTVTVTSIRNISKWQNGGRQAFLVPTTDMQDSRIIQYWQALAAKANNGTIHYNLITCNCAEQVSASLKYAHGLDKIASDVVFYPNEASGLLILDGVKLVSPSELESSTTAYEMSGIWSFYDMKPPTR